MYCAAFIFSHMSYPEQSNRPTRRTTRMEEGRTDAADARALRISVRVRIRHIANFGRSPVLSFKLRIKLFIKVLVCHDSA